LTGRVLQRWILRGLRGADVVVCDSKATTDDAERLVARDNPTPRLETVLLSLNFDYRKLPPDVVRDRLSKVPRFDVDLPFALHVGSNLRRKNRDGALRIFARCKDRWNGRMVFAGDALNDELVALAKGLNILDRVVQVRGPTCEILEALYNAATALVYPSRFEGFGWPIIEAHACGCPVICSNTGPMPEAAGDAGLLHAPEDEAGFAEDLVRLTDADARARWSEKSLRNAERFSTEKMIAQYIAIYRSLGAKL
jgi:glycosyltransferase involved in cell wall biosynthesis